jgi:hypothetical protein
VASEREAENKARRQAGDAASQAETTASAA